MTIKFVLITTFLAVVNAKKETAKERERQKERRTERKTEQKQQKKGKVGKKNRYIRK